MQVPQRLQRIAEGATQPRWRLRRGMQRSLEFSAVLEPDVQGVQGVEDLDRV
jgi:hypothetical protein